MSDYEIIIEFFVIPLIAHLCFALFIEETQCKDVTIYFCDFLLSKMFENDHFKVISNQGWHQKNILPKKFGEQPIDVAYTIQTLHAFYKILVYYKYLLLYFMRRLY